MADGRVLIDSKIDSTGAEKGADEIIDQLEDIEKEAQDTGETLKDDVAGGFKEIFSAAALADLATSALEEIGEAAVEIAKEAITAAADVRAANAQFSQTFADVEKEATDTLNAISENTGIAATRMQEAYTKIFAFTKSVGADTDTALNVSERAMRAAADSAAYYDKSIEEATETLQSFLKGNYENDAALGIAATETTRNAKANELYAQSFADLSEAQKVDVLLAMVEAGNEASGALGQAAREADSWTNVSGELEEAWRMLLATLGDPVLDELIPIIQDITDHLKKMTEASAYEELKDGMDDLADSIDSANEKYEESAVQIESTAIEAEYYVSRLEELESTGLKTAESQQEYANIVELLNELMPELNLQIDEQTGLLTENTESIRGSVEALKQRALVSALEERYTEVLNATAEATINVRQAEKELLELKKDEALITGQLNSAYARMNLELAETGTASSDTTLKIQELESALYANSVEQNLLSGEIENGNKVIAEQGEVLDEWAYELGLAQTETQNVTEAQEDLVDSSDDVRAALEKITAAYTEAKGEALESIQSQIGYFDELSTESDMTAESIVANWAAQAEAINSYEANLQKAVDAGLAPELLAQLADGSVESMMALDALVNSADTTVDEINAAFGERLAADEAVAGTIANIKTQLETAEWPEVDVVANLIVKPGAVKKAAASASSTIGNVTMTPYAMSASLYSGAENLPYLASGAVIPPNAPFVAVLGDQRSGTNIEAPLSTIQEAVENVMDGRQPQSISITFAGDLAQLGRVLKPVIDNESRRRGGSLIKGAN